MEPTESPSPGFRRLDLFLPAVYRALFTDPFTFRDNPLLTREERRDSRRYDTLLILLLTLASLLGAMALTQGILVRVIEARRLRMGIPSWLGGSYGALLMAVFSGVHVWFVAHAVYRRTHSFFLQEYRRNTLPTLLGTLIPPFQLVMQGALHPFRQGMLVAAAGLPFYAFALSLGGASVADLAGVYLVFALVAFAPPRWYVPVFAGLSAEEIVKKTKNYALAGSSYAFLAYGLNLLWLSWFVLFLTNIPVVAVILGPGAGRNLAAPLAQLIPPSIGNFWWPVPLTWVICAARWLLTPLPFYSINLPPVLLILPLFLCARLLAIWETSLFLRAGDVEQMGQLWDITPYWRARRLYGALRLLALAGLLWRPYVATGLTASLVSLRGDTRLALAGLLWLLGSWGALHAWGNIRQVIAAWEAAHIGRIPRPEELAHVVAPPATVLAIYTAGCLLAGRFPFPPPVLVMLGKLAILTVAGSLLARGLPRMLQFFWLAVLLLPLAGWLLPDGTAGEIVAAFSPLTGLLSLTPHTQRALNALFGPHALVPPWWLCALLTGGPGLLLHRRVKPMPVGSGAWTEPYPVHAPETALMAVLAEDPAENDSTLAGEAEAALPRKPSQAKPEYPAAQRLLAWLLARVDNAVATKELRVLLRGRLGPAELTTLIAVPVLLTGMALYYSDVVGEMLGEPAGVFFGPMGKDDRLFGGLAACWLLLAMLVAPFVAAGLCAGAFPKERDRSTLGFLLVTPMSLRAILLGKLFGLLLPTLAGLAAITLWAAPPALLLMLSIGPARVLTGLLLLLTILLTLTLLGGLFGLLCSSLLRRESDAAALSIFALLLFVGAVFILFGWIGDTFFRETAPVGLALLWTVCLLALALPFGGLSLALAWWRLARARHGDVAFEAARTQE